MVDIYFKCDWCKEVVEHKHVEKGDYIFNDNNRSTKLSRIELHGKDNYVCDECYNAIKNKVEQLKALSEVEGPYVKKSDAIYVKHNDNEINISRYSSADYQDSGVVTTCENK